MQYASKYIATILLIFLNLTILISEYHYHEILDSRNISFQIDNELDQCFDCLYLKNYNNLFDINTLQLVDVEFESDIFCNLLILESSTDYLLYKLGRAPPIDHF